MRNPLAPIGLPTDASDIGKHLLVALLARRDDQPTHAEHNHTCCAAVNAAREGNEEALSARASKVVPKPAGRSESNLFLWGVVPRLDWPGAGPRSGEVGGRKRTALCACHRRCMISHNFKCGGKVVGDGRHTRLTPDIPPAQLKVDGDAVEALAAVDGAASHGLHATALASPRGPDVVQVDCCCDSLDVVERELAALGNDAAITCYQRAPVVIESVPVATLLVRVEVDASQLRAGTGGIVRTAAQGSMQIHTLRVASRIRSTRR